RERLSSARSLSCLGGLARELGGCGRALGELLREVEAGRRREVLGLLYAPLEDKVAAYGELEAAQLQADMRAALGAAGVEGGEGDAGAVVSRLAGSIRPAFAALHAAVDRCNALTGGSEVRALLKAADTELSAYLAALQAAVAGLGERHRARVAAAATATTSAATTTASAAAAAAATAAAAAAAVDDGEDIANVLQLIKVGRELSAAVSRLEAVLRTAVATAVARLQALTAAPPTPSISQQQQQQQQQQHGGAAGATPFAAEATAAAASATASSSSASSSGVAVPHALSGAAEADPVALRLVAARGERLARLVKLGASLSDPRFMVLPGAVAQLEAFSATVQSTVFGVLLARVSALLAPLPGLPEWTKGGSAGGAHGGVAPLPAFNTYPLPYVTAIGDHLMAVPQQLEVLMGDTADDAPASATSATSATGEGAAAAAAAAAAGGGGDSAAEWEEVAAEWLDKVVSGAAGMYGEAVCRIPALSHQGGIQLSTDVEYFVNLMTALHVAPPPALLTLQLLAGAAPEEFGELARGALAEGGADAAAVRALAGMRRLPLE
ncbi:hypothetical protein Agub_g5739, partial [Astrephomene gubernaculifera]